MHHVHHVELGARYRRSEVRLAVLFPGHNISAALGHRDEVDRAPFIPIRRRLLR